MNRKTIFDRFRAILGRGFTPAEVKQIDAAIDEAEGKSPVVLSVGKAGLDLIKSFEGCKLTAYPDPGTGGDPWTIGWGSTGSDIKRGLVWTQQQADDRLVSDVAKFSQGVASLVGKNATQQQFDALTSFAYNVGLQALKTSTLLRLHNEGNYAAAAEQFARWNKAGGRVLSGLTRRRAAEAKLYREGSK